VEEQQFTWQIKAVVLGQGACEAEKEKTRMGFLPSASSRGPGNVDGVQVAKKIKIKMGAAERRKNMGAESMLTYCCFYNNKKFKSML
jgi:hypothetical protein